MKVVIDISQEDFNSICYKGLYFIGHDDLDVCVTKAFQSAMILPEWHGDLIDLDALKGELWWVTDCPRVKLNEQALDIWRAIEKAPTVIEADKGE